MNIVEKKIIYAGCEIVDTDESAQIEIYGLKNLIKQAEEKISRYEQAILIAKFKQKEQEKKDQEQLDGSTNQGQDKEKNI